MLTSLPNRRLGGFRLPAPAIRRRALPVEKVDDVSERSLSLGRWKSKLLRRHLLTISVQEDVARVVAFDGDAVTAWGTAYFQPKGPADEKQVSDKDVVDSDLRGLLAEFQKIRSRQVVSLPVRTALLRRLKLPWMGRKYLKEITLSELSNVVPFDADKADMVWQWRREKDEQEVFAAIAPKRAVDRHMTTLKQAGSRPSAAFSRAVALSYAAGVPDAVIVHLSSTLTEVVLVQNGIPQVSHVVEIHADWDADERVQTVTDAVSHVVSFFRTKTEAEKIRPVLLVGDVKDGVSIRENLLRTLGCKILPFNPGFTWPDRFPAVEYAVNLGLAHADRTAIAIGQNLPARAAPSLDIMPKRHMPRTLPVLQVAIFIPLILFAFVTLNISTRINEIHAEGTALTAQADSLERDARRLRLAATNAQNNNLRTQQSVALAATLDGFIDEREAARELLRTQMAFASELATLSNISLGSFSLQNNGLTLNGSAPSYAAAAAYSRQLQESGLFSTVRIGRAELASIPGAFGASGTGESQIMSVRFNLDASLTLPETEKAAETAASSSR